MTWPPNVHLPASLATHPLTWVVLFFGLWALRSTPLLVRLAGVSTCLLVIAVAAGWLPSLLPAEIGGMVTVLALVHDLLVSMFGEVAHELMEVVLFLLPARRRAKVHSAFRGGGHPGGDQRHEPLGEVGLAQPAN